MLWISFFLSFGFLKKKLRFWQFPYENSKIPVLILKKAKWSLSISMTECQFLLLLITVQLQFLYFLCVVVLVLAQL